MSAPGLATLETARLVLRPLRDGDLDAYAAMMADPEVARWVGAGGAPSTRADAWRTMALLIGHGVLRGYTNHAVVERASGRFVGRVGLWFPEGWPGLELGWALDRSTWGKGYATEAALAWRDHAFDVMGVDELISVIRVDNARSAAVARRIGHQPWRDEEVQGSPCTIWGQTRVDWERNRA